MIKQIQIGIIAYRKAGAEKFEPAQALCMPETEDIKRQQEFLNKAIDKLLAEGLLDYINRTRVKK